MAIKDLAIFALEIEVTSLRVVELAERGINVPFYDIVEMKKILLEN